MNALSPHDLLELWERGSRLHPLDQGLLALRAVLPEVQPQVIADWTLGRRNRALLELHCSSFNSRLEAWTECGKCGEKMEFEVDGRSLLNTSGTTAHQNETVEFNGLTFRLPTSRDLAEAAKNADPAQGAICILQRCCTGGDLAGWTEEDLNIAGDKLATADPIAEIRLSLTCPVCGDIQEETLDPVTFIWSELQARAKRLLHDIHTLASAYGWSEKEILSLSEFRRSHYVEIVYA